MTMTRHVNKPKTKSQQAFSKYARYSGAFKIALGIVLSFFIIKLIFASETNADISKKMLLLVVPMLFAWVGLLELFSGYPVLKLTQAIRELVVWQRVVLGLVLLMMLALVGVGLVFKTINT